MNHLLSLSLAGAVCGMISVLPASAVEIEVGYAYPATFDLTFQRIVAGFEARHPDIQVTFRATYDGYEDATNTILREAVAQTLPDVSFQALNRQAILVERGIAHPLDPYIATETDFDAAGYHTAMLNLSRFDGKIYGLPFAVSTPIGFFNMDVLKTAGVVTPPTTWAGVVDACHRIEASGTTEPMFWEWNISGNWLLQALMWSQGVPMIADGKLNMDNPQGLRALETAQALFRECHVRNMTGGDC